MKLLMPVFLSFYFYNLANICIFNALSCCIIKGILLFNENKNVLSLVKVHPKAVYYTYYTLYGNQIYSNI